MNLKIHAYNLETVILRFNGATIFCFRAEDLGRT